MPRPSKSAYYLKITSVVASRSTCLRRKYGAVIVVDDSIIATGYNGSPRGEVNCCDRGNCKRQELNIPPGERYELCEGLHSEMNACLEAGRKACKGGALYLCGEEVGTGEEIADPVPCLLCKKVLINSGIREVITRKGRIELK